MLACCCISSTFDVNAAEIVASTTSGSYVAEISEIILKQAYSKAGYDFRVLYVPGKRSLKMSNEGKVNAELMRIIDIKKNYHSLTPVYPALFDIRGTAFSLKKDIQSVEDFANDRVGVIRGVHWAKELTKNLSPVVMDDSEKLMKMLKAGRIDIAVASFITGSIALKKLGMEGVHISKPLVRLPVYHWLHKDSLYLNNPLSKILTRFEKEQKAGAIIDAYLQGD